RPSTTTTPRYDTCVSATDRSFGSTPEHTQAEALADDRSVSRVARHRLKTKPLLRSGARSSPKRRRTMGSGRRDDEQGRGERGLAGPSGWESQGGLVKE